MNFKIKGNMETFLKLCIHLFELSSDGFVVMNKDSEILYINPAYCQRLAITQEEAIGQAAKNVITNTDLPDMMKNHMFEPEHNIPWKVNPGQYTSEEKFAIVSRCVIRDENNEIIGAVGQVKFIVDTLRISNTIEKMNDELDYLKTEINRISSDRYSFNRIIGTSPAIAKTKELAAKAAKMDFPVLLTGESGVGKEVFANAIHYCSKRRTNPIVCVNCAAIPHELFESELFGYSDGAFTGAKKGGKKGKILLANHGTLFLDEIGDLPLSMQVKLLRVLQEQEVEAVGSTSPIPVDIRIITATNKNLKTEIDKGNFRLDLYYRINVLEIDIPPLRKRQDDIPLLAEAFLQELNMLYSSCASFQKDVFALLKSYSWPGNVRELHNVITRAYMFSDGFEMKPSHFPLNLTSHTAFTGNANGKSLDELSAEFEKKVILDTLKNCNGNVKKCAETLNIHRSTLYNKINAYEQK